MRNNKVKSMPKTTLSSKHYTRSIANIEIVQPCCDFFKEDIRDDRSREDKQIVDCKHGLDKAMLAQREITV